MFNPMFLYPLVLLCFTFFDLVNLCLLRLIYAILFFYFYFRNSASTKTVKQDSSRSTPTPKIPSLKKAQTSAVLLEVRDLDINKVIGQILLFFVLIKEKF